MYWSLVGFGLLAKNTADRDTFACSFVVSGSLAINCVATGGAFVLIVRMAVGAGCRAAGLPKQNNAAMGLTAGLAVTLTSGATVALGVHFPPKREPRAVKGASFPQLWVSCLWLLYGRRG